MKTDFTGERESAKFLNVVLDSVPIAIFLVDNEARLQSVNNAFVYLFGRETGEVIGSLCGNAFGCVYPVEEKTLCGTTSYCGKCSIRKSIIKAFSKKEDSPRFLVQRFFYVNSQKIEKYLYVSVRCLSESEKEHVVVFMEDVTELETSKRKLQQQRDRLSELNIQKNRFLSIAAHDIRNPAAMINMVSRSLLEEHSDEKIRQNEDYVSHIYHQSGYMIRLLEDLLDVSVIESGKINLNISRSSYINLVKKAVRVNSLFAAKKQITIVFEPPDHDCDIDYDETRIEQVLNNLISNSIKYSSSGSIIEVLVRHTSEGVLTEVLDEGGGVSDEDLSRLFEPFFKSTSKPTGGESSTGLGLAIVKKIIEEHHGQVWAENRENGDGLAISYVLPTSYLYEIG